MLCISMSANTMHALRNRGSNLYLSVAKCSKQPYINKYKHTMENAFTCYYMTRIGQITV